MKSRSKIQGRLLASTVFVSSALAATPAFAQGAQTAENNDDAIVVTGTLVRNPNLVASSPVNTVGEEEIELQQANVAEELLRELPGAVPSIGSAVNNGNGGASFVNLRGLGSNRNVVLIDGVRLVPAELNGRFDLNNIPLALIQRVDVLTGGASTTYGADAVSGVVNFITRRDFAGIDINVSEQITERGDGNIFRADVTIGANFDDGRGNATLSVGYQEADPVYQGARDYSIFNVDTFTGGAGGSGTAVPSRFTGVNTTLAGCGAPDPDGPGPLVAEPSCATAQGTRQVNDAGTAFLPTAAFTAFNFNPYNIFQTPFERFNIYGAANYQISDALEIYTRGLFSKNTVDTIIAPSGAFGIQVTVPLSSPFLTAAQRNAFCAFDTNNGAPYTPLYSPAVCAAAALAVNPADPNFRTVTTVLSRRGVELGPRVSSFTTTIFDYRLGARGGITDSIDWDVFGSYGESENLQSIQGYYLNSRVRAAVYATNPNTCLPNAPLGGSTAAGCIPVNFFGTTGNPTFSAAALDFLNETSTVLTRVTLAQARGTVSGDFGWNLPWASQPVSFAVGGEFREYNASQVSDTLAQGGDLGGAGGAAPNIDGGFNVYEAFGELIVPIVSDRPFFDLLEVRGGIRYSDYAVRAPGSPGFSTTTWKVEGTWAPVSDLRFRGSYSRAVRAPNVAELFSPVNTGLTNLNDDPCANLTDAGLPNGRPVPTGELLAICLAQGAPAGQIGAIGVPTAGQANATGGGNLALQPEKSTSWTVGAVFQPSFVPGLSASIDYYNIRVTGAITSPTPGDAIAACFGPGAGLTPAAGASGTLACQIIRRNPTTGQLSGDPNTTPGLFLSLSNLGLLETSGVDFVVNYRRNIDILGGMGLAFNFVLNWTDESIFEAVQGVSGPRDCVGFYSPNCGSIQPEWQWSLRTTATFDNIDISLLWRHIDQANYEDGPDGNNSDPAFAGTLGAGLGALSGRTVDFNHIPSADYFDLTGRFAVDDHLTITLSVQNLLDRQPPIVGSTAGSTSFNSGNTYPSTYDALGRRFTASARIRF